MFPVDPLLSQIPEPVRPIFFYNEGLYGQTKDGVLWIKDLEEARLRPHFQPAYPLLMSFIATIMPAKLILYVAPLFTLFAAFAMWTMGTLLFRSNWAGLASATFFLANPVTVWHGRCARAETPAVFFLFAGLFFLLYAWKNRNAFQLQTILLGSICVFISSFFHILTWFAIIPLSVWIFFMLLNGRKEFRAFFLCFFVSITLFLLQTIFVTDAYSLAHTLGRLTDTLNVKHLIAGLVFLGFLAFFFAYYQKYQHLLSGRISPRRLGTLIVAVSLSALLFVVFLGDTYPIRGLLQPYLRWTDFEGLRYLLSRPLLLLSLLGGILLVMREGQGGQAERILLWIVLLPGILLMGWVDNHMLDNRRFLLFLVPWMALSFMALIMFLRERIPGKTYAACAAMLLILFLTIQNRTHLYTLQEYENLLDFFAPYAQTVKENNGILLFEYTRFGAIFDHFFGIPTLSLNNEIHLDYTAAEKAWQNIMLAQPDRPAFFATPFQPPQSNLFDFTPVHQDRYSGLVLKQERRRLPTIINTHYFYLTLYRMSIAQEATATFPFHAQINAGNMGLTRFANMRREQLPIQAIPMAAGKEYALPIQLPDTAAPSELLLIFHKSFFSSDMPPDMKIKNEADFSIDWLSLAPGWWLARILFADPQPGEMITLLPQTDLLLSTVKGVFGEHVHDFDLREFPGRTQVVIPFIQARWARNNADMILPLPERQSDVFILMIEHGSEEGRELHLHGDSDLLQTLHLLPATWAWHMLRLPAEYASSNRLRLTFRVPTPWDPGLSNFPDDLAVLVGHVSVVPR
ncbi:hypothetical protein [Desulfonatronum parangueonense]